eukprot:4397480-Karenia_brevis.AAC.1
MGSEPQIRGKTLHEVPVNSLYMGFPCRGHSSGLMDDSAMWLIPSLHTDPIPNLTPVCHVAGVPQGQAPVCPPFTFHPGFS